MDLDELRSILLAHVEHVARRLRKHAMLCRTISLKLRRPDFTTLTRSITLDRATEDTGTLWRESLRVFDSWASSPAAGSLRLLGIHLSGLCAAVENGAVGEQLPLFTTPQDPSAEKRAKVDRVTDLVATRFGTRAIGRARSVRPACSP
jgi:DNA polymerase IV